MAFVSKEQATVHVVRSGESLAGLAKAAGVRWQDLAKYNWGTDVPEEINEALYHVVGVRKRAPDGVNWSFGDDDVSRGTHPQNGKLLIPQPFSMEGLLVGAMHEVVVRVPRRGELQSLRVLTDFSPDEAKENVDAFRLVSPGPPAYDRRLRVGDDHVVAGSTIALTFEGLDLGGTYTLTVELSDGRVETLFSEVPYGGLAALSEGDVITPR